MSVSKNGKKIDLDDSVSLTFPENFLNNDIMAQITPTKMYRTISLRQSESFFYSINLKANNSLNGEQINIFDKPIELLIPIIMDENTTIDDFSIYYFDEKNNRLFADTIKKEIKGSYLKIYLNKFENFCISGKYIEWEYLSPWTSIGSKQLEELGRETSTCQDIARSGSYTDGRSTNITVSTNLASVVTKSLQLSASISLTEGYYQEIRSDWTKNSFETVFMNIWKQEQERKIKWKLIGSHQWKYGTIKKYFHIIEFLKYPCVTGAEGGN